MTARTDLLRRAKARRLPLIAAAVVMASGLGAVPPTRADAGPVGSSASGSSTPATAITIARPPGTVSGQLMWRRW